MSQKINYHLQEQALLKEISSLPNKPTLLLHSCCAPCNAYVMQYLAPYFKVSLYFNNSNIYPLSEYNIRKDELVNYVDSLNAQGYDFELIVTEYNPDFQTKLEPLKHVREGRERCSLCFSLRMKEAFAYANEHHFDYFTTVMSISRQKNSQTLNKLGANLAKFYPNTKYFHSDFKKNDGNLKGVAIAREHNMYRQNYCGCKFSMPTND